MTFEDHYVTEQDDWGIDDRVRRESENKRREEERRAFDEGIKCDSLSSLLDQYNQILKRLGSPEFEGVKQAARRGEMDTALDYGAYSNLEYKSISLRAEINRRAK